MELSVLGSLVEIGLSSLSVSKHYNIGDNLFVEEVRAKIKNLLRATP